MAVPPMQPARGVAAGSADLARPLRASLMLDVILGLLVAVTLPLAIVAVPNTISVVAALLPPDVSQIEMVRAHGLALPAMVLTVPLAALFLRRVRAVPVLVAGLALLALADAAGGYAGSASLVGVLRALHGVGAGLLLPASLVTVWERSAVLRALWAGMLAVSLTAAQALALWPLNEVRSWRVALQPYPMLTGVALVLAAVYLVFWIRSGEGSASPEVMRGGRLPVAAGSAAAVATLALGTTFDWPPGLLVLVAVLSIIGLFLLASASGFGEGAGRAPAYTMLVVGVVVLPTAAQVTNVELGGLSGPGLSGLWPAFLVAGILGLAAAVAVSRLGESTAPLCAAGGLAVLVAGLCAVRALLPTAEGLALLFPFALLTAGAAVALTAVLRPSGVGVALFALSLFLPGILSGFLLGTGVQLTMLRQAETPQAMVDAFVGALHLWALVGGGLVVATIVLGAALARRTVVVRAGAVEDEASQEGVVGNERSVSVPAPAPPVDSAPSPVGSTGDDRSADEAEEEGPDGAVPETGPGRDPGAAGAPEPGTLPVVPPPTPSPEGALGDGVDRP
ncbi:hypothetical protein ABZ470_40350 [Streptosporangium sp. NPDC020072]|uniref:hypothetical protein n=1 Tax=Streptosporangium sp. NPDC020072 TaxID=3154788 RepID=UPI00343682B2